MPNYFQIGPGVSDKISFTFALYSHRKSWPRSLTTIFFSTDLYNLNKLGKGSLKDH